MRLQYYDDPERRSNQKQEGNNGHLNVIYSRFKKGRRTFERYLHCFQSVEVETATRRYRVEQYGDYAPVNEDSVIRTRSIVGLVNQHKRGALSDKEYFNQLVALITKSDGDLRDEDIK